MNMKSSELPKASKSEDGDVVDFISNMPDAILVSILSRLKSTEEVIRSSILSTRWRYLWTLIPSLDIEICYRDRDKKSQFKEFVYWVLANKTVDLDSFRLWCDSYYNVSTVCRWIHIAITKNVKQLDLSFCTKKKKSKDIKLPHCLMTCGSLEVLRLALWRCGLSLPNFKFKGFPALRVLELTYVDLLTDTDLVKSFLESCLLLEELSLFNCDISKLDHLCISCPKLKRLSIVNRDKRRCHEIRISCPKLVDLDLTGYIACSVFVDCLDSLKKFVYDHARFESGTGPVLFHGNSPVKPLWTDLFFLCECIDGACDLALPNLKTLVLRTNMDAFTVDELIQILKYCSKLESLKLTIRKDYGMPGEWDLHEGDARRIMTPDVKRMEFFELNGEKPKVDIGWRSSWDDLKMVFSWGN